MRKLQKTLLSRRNSTNSVTFKVRSKDQSTSAATAPEQQQSTASKPPPLLEQRSAPNIINSKNPIFQKRTSLKDDEILFVNTGKSKIMLKDRGPVPPLQPTAQFSNQQGQRPQQPENVPFNIVDDFIDRLNMGKIGHFLKRITISIINKILSSPYINSTNDGKIHIHSFGLGVLMTSIVVIIQPFLMVYLDSWMILLGRLFKHLIAWCVVGGVISYVLNPNRQTKRVDTSSLENDQNSRYTRTEDTYKELQYSVKPSRSASPTKQGSPKRPNISTKSSHTIMPMNTRRPSSVNSSDQNYLMKLTEQTQAIERARYDVEMSRLATPPLTNYDQFMDIAHKKDGEKQKYTKFVNDNKDVVKKKKEEAFGAEI